MSRPVDVLAVMDELADEFRGLCNHAEGERLDEARAAVAELVEAVEEFRAAAFARDADDVGRSSVETRYFIASSGLTAALAKFGGAA